MYITITKKELTEAVNKAVRFSERRSATLPVLGAVVLLVTKNEIHLQATNLETGIDLQMEGVVKSTGTVALPASVLKEITSSFSGNGSVSLEQKGDTVELSGDGAKSVIKTMPVDDFPSVSSTEDTKIKTTISGALLRSLITLVAPYASVSTVRPELGSVLLKSEGGTITAVATDSFRLAEKKVSIESNLSPFSILIPAKNALLIAETITDDPIDLFADDHQCTCVFRGGKIMSRLVAAEYPDYVQIIPKSFTATATVLKKDFDSALKRTSIFSDSFQKVRLGFSPKEKNVSLSSRNNDVGETEEHITASVEGEGIELSFNYRYLSAPLSSFTSESITLSSSGIGRPLVIRGVGDASFLYLVMPMNQ